MKICMLQRIDYSGYSPYQEYDHTTVKDCACIAGREADELCASWGHAWMDTYSGFFDTVSEFLKSEAFEGIYGGNEVYWLPNGAEGVSGPFMEHYGAMGSVPVPVPEELIVRPEKEPPYVIQSEVISWMGSLNDNAPRRESPPDRNGIAYRVTEEKVMAGPDVLSSLMKGSDPYYIDRDGNVRRNRKEL